MKRGGHIAPSYFLERGNKMSAVDTVLTLAANEVGYLEKATNSSLYEKTSNAGYNNYTKYAYDFQTKYPNFYNGRKNGYAWCDVFVDWLFVTSFGEEIGRNMLYQPTKSAGAGCYYSAAYYKQAGKFGTTPQRGAQIFFLDSSGDVCHTGIVYAVDNNYVYTIEGNTSNASGVVANGGGVAKKSYARNYSRIYGYGYPNYDLVDKKTGSTTTTTTPTSTTTSTKTITVKTYKNGSTDETVYADSSFKVRIGSLNPYETCDCLGKVDGAYIVKYQIDGTSHYKVGFVEYNGGL